MSAILKTLQQAAAAIVLASLGFVCAAARQVPDDEEDPYFLLTEEAGKAIESGDYESAAKRLTEAMAMRPGAPENVLLMSNLGLVYSYMERDSLAIATFDEALRIAPSMRTVLTNRARVLLKTGRDAEAYSDLGKVIEADSLNGEARYLHGLLAMGMNDFATAGADFDVLREADPDGLPTAVGMATLLCARGEHREALPYLRTLVEKSGEADDYASLAISLIEVENLAEAAETIGSGLTKYPDSGELYLCRARLNKARYSYSDAKADAKRAAELGIEKERIKALRL